jgi:hypothetical protein
MRYPRVSEFLIAPLDERNVIAEVTTIGGGIVSVPAKVHYTGAGLDFHLGEHKGPYVVAVYVAIYWVRGFRKTLLCEYNARQERLYDRDTLTVSLPLEIIE